jgi:hypothetical protein
LLLRLLRLRPRLRPRLLLLLAAAAAAAAAAAVLLHSVFEVGWLFQCVPSLLLAGARRAPFNNQFSNFNSCGGRARSPWWKAVLLVECCPPRVVGRRRAI